MLVLWLPLVSAQGFHASGSYHANPIGALLGGAGLGRRDENGGQADGGLTVSLEKGIRSQRLGTKGSESGKQ